MAIFTRVKTLGGAPERDAGGNELRVPVADFSYTNDVLAQMIVDAWVDVPFRQKLLDRTNAQSILAERGIFLQNPVIISEDDYRNDAYTKDFDDEIVFVLPDPARVDMRKPQSLLETARFLMACVPNGI